MVSIDRSDIMFTEFPPLDPFKAVGVGPAIGSKPNCVRAFSDLLDNIGERSLVVDADAITILASEQSLLSKLPKNTVLTPHPGEFRRLVGDWNDDFHRLEKAVEFSATHKVVLVLKGAYTAVISPDGSCYFNPTGNPGMATAGSGDVLTGIILSLLGQGIAALDAARAGAYIHGLAGDMAMEEEGEAALTASDIIRYLGKAISSIQK
jgi:NAD(P)H-hydrate epimerase